MVRLLPEPDSPTTPSDSPSERMRLTPSTARTVPAAEGNSIDRFSISSRAIDIGPWTSALQFRIERVAQAIADKVEGQNGDQDHEAGEGDDPPRPQHEFARIRQHRAPFRQRRLRSEAKIYERR